MYECNGCTRITQWLSRATIRTLLIASRGRCGYVLSITNSKGIVDYSGADPVVDLARCPPWLPNLAFSKIYVTLNRGDPPHTTLLLHGGERGDFYIRSPESM